MKNKKIIVWTIVIIGIFSILWLVGKNKSSSIVESDSSGIPAHRALENVASVKNESTTKTKDQLVVPETFYDFGTISMKNGLVTKVFKVKNNTGQDILFPSLVTSCMCTKAYFVQPDGSKKGPFGMPGMGMVPKLNETIKAGQSADVEVVYDPNAHGPAGVGMIDRFVYLEDLNGKKTTFEIKAIVTP